VFLRELRELYAAMSGDGAGLRPPSLQFGDFAAWQRELLETEIADQQLAYWRQRLADPPEPMVLPYESSRPARQTFRGDQVVHDLSPNLTERLREFARAEG